MSLTFRPLDRDDAAAIADLMSNHPLWQERNRTEQTRAINRAIERGEYGLVAEDIQQSRHALTGFVMMSDGTFGEYGYIRLIGTRHQSTGQGIGGRLLEEAEELFVTRGVERVFLLCTESNTGARSFYERHGYSRVGQLPDWLRPGVSELIYMKRDLRI